MNGGTALGWIRRQVIAARSTRGLTLIELLIILAIIGVLTSIGLLLYANFTDQARIARAVAIGAHFETHGATPTSTWISPSGKVSHGRTMRCTRSTQTSIFTARAKMATVSRRLRRPRVGTTSSARMTVSSSGSLQSIEPHAMAG
jgi:prepilin-type N-terminal cleavage/methylation domain-containing protein